jgi:hypothetical protein
MGKQQQQIDQLLREGSLCLTPEGMLTKLLRRSRKFAQLHAGSASSLMPDDLKIASANADCSTKRSYFWSY